MLTPPSPRTAVIRASAPGSIRDLDLPDRDPCTNGRLRRQTEPGALGRVERLLDARRVGVGDLGTEGFQALDEQIDRRGDLLAVRDQDLAPQGRLRRGQAGEVTEPAGGQQEDVLLPRLPVRRGPHQGRGGDLRQMADDRDEPVVPLRVHHDGPGAEPIRPRADGVGRRRVRFRHRREDPDDPVDDGGRGVFGAGALAAAHRVTRHESGHALDGRRAPDVADHAALHARSVGHDRVGGGRERLSRRSPARRRSGSPRRRGPRRRPRPRVKVRA